MTRSSTDSSGRAGALADRLERFIDDKARLTAEHPLRPAENR